MLPVMSQNRDKHAGRIGRTVRAELTRRGRSVSSLQPVLGIERSALNARTRGEVCFDYAELVLIATDLGMPVARLIESAEADEQVAA